MRLLDPAPPLPRSASASAERDAVLRKLLDAAQGFAPEYAPLMASHLTMALAALHGLGATPAQLRRYFAQETAHLAPLAAPAGDPAPIATGAWTELLGRLDAFPVLRAHFAAALARAGRDACLRVTLPLLLPGFGAVAFHGAIRTAHAIETGHDDELATALGYWAARWTVPPAPLPGQAAFTAPGPWLDALDAHLRERAPDWRPSGRLISHKMPQASATSTYAELAGAVRSGEPVQWLDGLLLSAARRYAATRNFTVLHLATAARSLRVLLPWLETGPELPDAVWHAVAAASLASGTAWSVPAPSAGGGADAHWPTVLALACASDDDHVIKLVHAMADQQRRQPDPVWLAAAARAVAGSGRG